MDRLGLAIILEENDLYDLSVLTNDARSEVTFFKLLREEFISVFEIRLDSLKDHCGEFDRRTVGLATVLRNLALIEGDVLVCSLSCSGKEITIYLSSLTNLLLGYIEW